MTVNVGIGLCSYKRPDLANKICSEILSTVDNSKYNIQTVCSVDDSDISGYETVKSQFNLIYGENSGISVNKNRLLKYLKNNDIIFICEDDISFIKTGWIDIYLNAIQVTGIQHFNYIVSDYRKFITKILKFNDDVSLGITGPYVNGVLMVMTKKCIDTVGGFDMRFKKYGYEHAEFTRRCSLNNLYPPQHVHLMSASEYIDWKHSDSVIVSSEKQEYINYNAKIFHTIINKNFIPYETVGYINA
jgi:glycosyltransferase involved in cell wall biosynthesis